MGPWSNPLCAASTALRGPTGSQLWPGASRLPLPTPEASRPRAGVHDEARRRSRQPAEAPRRTISTADGATAVSARQDGCRASAGDPFVRLFRLFRPPSYSLVACEAGLPSSNSLFRRRVGSREVAGTAWYSPENFAARVRDGAGSLLFGARRGERRSTSSTRNGPLMAQPGFRRFWRWVREAFCSKISGRARSTALGPL
jgi:hypothetical protein